MGVNTNDLPGVGQPTETLEIQFKTARGIIGRRIKGLTEDEITDIIRLMLDEDVEILELLR